MEDLFHEIVKYPPSGYNKDGIYMYDDWTSISDKETEIIFLL
jgi:hypothetical protein